MLKYTYFQEALGFNIDCISVLLRLNLLKWTEILFKLNLKVKILTKSKSYTLRIQKYYARVQKFWLSKNWQEFSFFLK